MSKNDIKFGTSLTPPVLGGFFGSKSQKTATKDGKTGYGDTKAAAAKDLAKK